MCGIFGSFGLKLSHKTTSRCFELLAHRGPDSSGLFHADNDAATLGAVRLSFKDIDNGNQPFIYKSDSDWGYSAVCLNGEIYNYKSLKNELKDSLYSFKTTSDTEIIYPLYEKHGLGHSQVFRGGRR